MTIRVFLVDDHRSVLWGLQRLIDGEKPRMEVAGFATSIEEALAAVPGARADVVLLDLDIGGKSGIDAIPRLIEAKRWSDVGALQTDPVGTAMLERVDHGLDRRVVRASELAGDAAHQPAP